MMKQRQKSSNYLNDYKRLTKDSDDDDESTELFVRNKPRKREIPSMEKNVEDSDTLQSLAIRYHCSIEELKRLNNIHKENEIFAKNTIKVPLHPISLALAGVHLSGKSSPDEHRPSTSQDLLSSELFTSLNKLPEKKNELNDIIFNSQYSAPPIPLVSLLDNNPVGDNDEETRLLPQAIEPEPVEPNAFAKLDCSGADAGISWISLVVCIIILILAVPLIYVFYIAEHIEQYHHPHST